MDLDCRGGNSGAPVSSWTAGDGGRDAHGGQGHRGVGGRGQGCEGAGGGLVGGVVSLACAFG